MSRKCKKTKFIEMPMFSRGFFCTVSLEEAVEFVERQEYSHDFRDALGCCLFPDRDEYPIMWFRSDSMDVNTIAHECTHMSKRTIESLGMEINDETEELLCYMIGWMVEEVWKFKEELVKLELV